MPELEPEVVVADEDVVPISPVDAAALVLLVVPPLTVLPVHAAATVVTTRPASAEMTRKRVEGGGERTWSMMQSRYLGAL
jgi:hypothetical protein